MGYEELIQDLIRESESKAERILGGVREEARRMIAEAMERAEQMSRQFQDGLDREAGRERSVRMNRVKMEGRVIVLQARVALMEEVFTRLEDRLRSLPQRKDYPRLVERLYQEIFPELPEGVAVVRADAKALPVLKTLIKGRKVRFESLPEEEFGGLEASDEAGRFLVRNTLKARFLKARSQFMIEINRWLSEADA